jgi:hypothetical protein
VDQNFLIYCTKNPTWQRKIKEAHNSAAITVVLSPWHFYECGNGAAHSDADELLNFTEKLEPEWIIERADLQLFEFWVVWNQVWNSSKDIVEPIGTFSEIAAIVSKVDERHLRDAKMRDYVSAFSQNDALAEVKKTLENHRSVSDTIRNEYLRRRSDKPTWQEMELRHLAVQLARLELKAKGTDRVWCRADRLVHERPIRTQMEFFISSGFTRELKCHATEAAFTEELFVSGGGLDASRFVDRQHASVALPYCDRFITDDGELSRRCARITGWLPFQSATVMSGEDFLRTLP